MKKKVRNNDSDVIQVRDDIYVSKSSIDVIVHTDTHPSNNEKMGEYKWIIYFRDSHYSWIILSEREFNKYIKPLQLSY